jgi:putative ABC transport system permease protein
MLIQHLKFSVRKLKQNKMFSFLNITGFAFGFAVCMVLALFAFKEHNVDKCYPDYTKIYRIIDTKKNSSRIDFDIARPLKEQYPDIKSVIPLNYMNFGGNPTFLKKQTGNDFVMANEMISTTNDFFKAFSVKIIEGNAEKPFADLNSVVLTLSTARKLFDRTDVIGEHVDLGDISELSVSAVSEDLPSNSSLATDIFFNADNEKFRFSQYCNNGQCYNPIDLYVILKDRANLKQLENLINGNIPVNKSGLEKIHFQPLDDIYFQSGIEGNNNKAGSLGMIRIFLSIAVLIMLLSIINYVNFSMSKQLSTLKEIGIKIANGAGTSQLRTDYLTDVSLSVLIAFVLGLGITWLLLPIAAKLLDTSLNFSWMFSPLLMGVFSVILLVVILISSFAPAYIVSKFDVQKLLRKNSTMLGKQYGRKVLTVFQISTAIALLIGLMAIQKQLHYVKSADLGFNKERLVRLDLGEAIKGQDALKQLIDQCNFVQGSSFSHGAPGSVFMGMGSNHKEGENFSLDCINVDEQFLRTFGIELLKGRELMASDKNNACIINETAFKRFGWDNLENKRFNNGRKKGYQVVGVVHDFNVASLHSGMTPVCLIYNNQYTSLNIRLLPGNVGEQISKIRTIWKGIAPETPMIFTFYDSFFNAFYQKEDRQGEAITFFSLITFIITCLGLMGQVFQTCNTRIKEIGIRKVNGAKISEVMVMLNRDFVIWVVIAFLIATPIAWYVMHRWLENFAYKTELSWWIFALAGLLALGIALLTVSWQSWRAATRNPVEALRYE